MTLASDLEPPRRGGVLLGEDWMGGEQAAAHAMPPRRQGRGVFAVKGSPLARKIVVFNLLAVMGLVAGLMFVNPSRDGLVLQHVSGLVGEAELVADVFEAQLALGATPDAGATVAAIDLTGAVEVFVFDAEGEIAARAEGNRPDPSATLSNDSDGMVSTAIDRVWSRAASLLEKGTGAGLPEADPAAMAARMVSDALSGQTRVETATLQDGTVMFTVATPIMHEGRAQGVVAVTSAAGEIERLVHVQRRQVLQMFVVAVIVSVILSLVLASTIANPLAELAAAAEIGQESNSRAVRPSRVRIPDLGARPDEIGRLSSALRGMVAALYGRIECNEQFAADVAHEIKNPLASLRSAVGSLRVVKKEEHREKLLDVIEHDVRRLDRLVSDISNASRLDSELVKEDEEAFDLIKMLGNLSDYLGREADEKGIEFIADLPRDPIVIDGLESRLAQVFVNLITNAISFCGEGDAIRLWARKREDRVLVVVEDTGPGIPNSALTKIFNRFYSERPEGQFGNNSGLGLAISKQIVEAHGGVIWAENIQPTDADPVSEPLGARFVVGLPV